MIFQHIYQILELYCNHIESLKIAVDEYCKEIIIRYLQNNIKNKNQVNQSLIKFLRNELLKLGFKKENIDFIVLKELNNIKKNETHTYSDFQKFLITKINPLILELILLTYFEYLVNNNLSNLLLNLKSIGLFPMDFIFQIGQLKQIINNNPEYIKKIRNYIYVKDKIIELLRINKERISELQKVENSLTNLQLLYIIYRIIEFFGIQEDFDFHILKEYIKNNFETLLIDTPLVSLRNPEIYYCTIYLANKLNILINLKNVNKFLEEIYLNIINNFDAPVIQGTRKIYYYLKSLRLINSQLSEKKADELLRGSNIFYENDYLKELETSRLVVILKMLGILKITNKIESYKINSIKNEIEKRIISNSTKQYKDEFASSETIYYTLFYYYTNNFLDKIKDLNIIDELIYKIYRNSEVFILNEDTNYDLISEIFYTLESLKLLNCINEKNNLVQFSKYLFPEKVYKEIFNSHKDICSLFTYRKIYIDKINGDSLIKAI